jgi:hypothetical protein
MGSVNRVILLGNLGADPEIDRARLVALLEQVDKEFAVYVFDNTVETPGRCIVWTGDIAHGYGVCNFKKERRLAHRKILAVLGQDIGGKVVCHRCDNRPCINPEHLIPADAAFNLRDASSKDRLARKLTNAAAAEIRRQYTGGAGYGRLATRFGVSRGMVRDIVKGRRWAWAQ